ncbi:hypothetical protein EVA_19236, partial [gut metagenome]
KHTVVQRVGVKQDGQTDRPSDPNGRMRIRSLH